MDVVAKVLRTYRFWATVCKTLRPMLSEWTVVLSVCPVCDIGELWPNGWMDQDETWIAGRPRPRPHCVRWGPSSADEKGHTSSPTFKIYGRRLCLRPL